MNWKLLAGSSCNKVLHAVLRSSAFPLTRYFPRGKSWVYDAMRFTGRRRLDVIFDVGANVGQTAVGLAKYCPQARIYSFEPVKSTFDILTKNVRRYSNIRCFQFALGSARGTQTIELRENSELNTLLPNTNQQSYALLSQIEQVSIETLDEFCSRESVSRIDMLKMDVQGFELEVLKGGRQLLDNHMVKFVFSEVAFRSADSEMQSFSDINDYLESKGFWLCGFYDFFRWGANKEKLGFCNALYMNPQCTHQTLLSIPG